MTWNENVDQIGTSSKSSGFDRSDPAGQGDTGELTAIIKCMTTNEGDVIRDFEIGEFTASGKGVAADRNNTIRNIDAGEAATT